MKLGMEVRVGECKGECKLIRSNRAISKESCNAESSLLG